jgi:hypothetical protein
MTIQMTDEITLDGAGIMRQAHMTAHDFMLQAVSDIDEILGEGAARSCPELIAAYLNAAALDGGMTLIAQQIRLGLKEIAGELDAVVTMISEMDINK